MAENRPESQVFKGTLKILPLHIRLKVVFLPVEAGTTQGSPSRFPLFLVQARQLFSLGSRASRHPARRHAPARVIDRASTRSHTPSFASGFIPKSRSKC